jgi:hypothetical protein
MVATHPHGGAKCLRFAQTGNARYFPSLALKLPELTPGIYQLRFWVRANALQSDRGGVRVDLSWRGGTANTEAFKGTFDWKQVTIRAAVPADAGKGLTIKVGRYADVKDGEIFFDDFTLEKALPPDVEAYLRYPNYRGYLPDDGPQKVRVWVRVNNGNAPAPAQVVVTAANGKEVAARTLPAGAGEQVVELDAAQWPLGQYRLTARIGDFAYPAYVLTKLSARQRDQMAVWFDADNVAHIRGQKVFPLGIYNTTIEFSTINDAEMRRLDEIKQAPLNFNINYTWWACGLADRAKYIGALYDRGMFYLDTLMPYADDKPIQLGPKEMYGALHDLMPEIPLAPGKPLLATREEKDRYLTLLAEKTRPLPGAAGWYVMDEATFKGVPRFFHLCDVMRRADPDHPTYGVSTLPEELVYWRDVLDVFGVDPYPLMNMGLGRPLATAGHWTAAAMAATQQSRPVWTVIQFFQGWTSDRWPTREELRAMSLMAITDGARGLFYWSFGMRALAWTKPSERADYWQRLVEVAKEIKSLEPALVAPDAPEIVKSVSDANLHWRARAADGKWYVFAYLPAAKFADRENWPAVKAAFTLRDGQTVEKSFKPDTAEWFAVTPK